MKLARGSATSLCSTIAARSRIRDSSFAIVLGFAISLETLDAPWGRKEGSADPRLPLHPGLVAELPLDLDHAERLEHVPGLHVLEVAHDDAAVEALANFLRVVLLAPQRRE